MNLELLDWLSQLGNKLQNSAYSYPYLPRAKVTDRAFKNGY